MASPSLWSWLWQKIVNASCVYNTSLYLRHRCLSVTKVSIRYNCRYFNPYRYIWVIPSLSYELVHVRPKQRTQTWLSAEGTTASIWKVVIRQSKPLHLNNYPHSPRSGIRSLSSRVTNKFTYFRGRTHLLCRREQPVPRYDTDGTPFEDGSSNPWRLSMRHASDTWKYTSIGNVKRRDYCTRTTCIL